MGVGIISYILYHTYAPIQGSRVIVDKRQRAHHIPLWPFYLVGGGGRGGGSAETEGTSNKQIRQKRPEELSARRHNTPHLVGPFTNWE